jgi:biotin operon repressor
MRTRYGIILLTFILLAVVAVNGSSNPVSAQSCAEQLGYSSLSTTQYYYNSNIAITVPVSATCSYVATQLYAAGNAYDVSSQRNLGSVSTQLTIASGNTLTGQLVFNLPPSIIGHQLQVTVLVYSGYSYGYGYGGNGVPLATATQLLRVNVNNYQNGYNSQYGNCYQNPYCSYPGNSNGNYPGNFNGNYYTTCQSTGNTNTVQCSGYLYQPTNGCVELAIPIENGYWFESRVYQYYTLQNLPSSYNPAWRWVTVTGQLYQGYNMASNGASCPGNYIIVNSISP